MGQLHPSCIPSRSRSTGSHRWEFNASAVSLPGGVGHFGLCAHCPSRSLPGVQMGQLRGRCLLSLFWVSPGARQAVWSGGRDLRASPLPRPSSGTPQIFLAFAPSTSWGCTGCRVLKTTQTRGLCPRLCSGRGQIHMVGALVSGHACSRAGPGGCWLLCSPLVAPLGRHSKPHCCHLFPHRRPSPQQGGHVWCSSWCVTWVVT